MVGYLSISSWHLRAVKTWNSQHCQTMPQIILKVPPCSTRGSVAGMMIGYTAQQFGFTAPVWFFENHIRITSIIVVETHFKVCHGTSRVSPFKFSGFPRILVPHYWQQIFTNCVRWNPIYFHLPPFNAPKLNLGKLRTTFHIRKVGNFLEDSSNDNRHHPCPADILVVVTPSVGCLVVCWSPAQ